MLSRNLAKTTSALRFYSSSTFQESKRVAELSTLANGLRVVSLSGGSAGPAVGLGLYINTGTRNETNDTAGVNQVLKNMVFQSNANKLYLEVQREIELMGSTAFAQVSRDSLLVSTQCLPPSSQQMLHALADISNPTLPFHEVNESTETTREESEALQHDTATLVFEAVHRAAFRGRTLGRPLVAPICNIGNISSEQVAAYASQVYAPSNMVLVAVGVNHKDLVAEAEGVNFGRTVAAPAGCSVSVPREAAKYVGGEDIAYQSGNTHVVVGFSAPALKNTKEMVAASVFQALLGTGSSMPRTAPGHGRTSRLFQLLEKNASIVKTDSFNLSYGDAGLFGVYAETSGAASQAVATLVGELTAAANASGQELERAKALTKSYFLELAENRSAALEFVGRQALYNAKILTPEEFAQEISKITAQDVKSVASKILSSKPTLVVRGDISDVPTIEEVSTLISKSNK
eukprot:gene5626-6490_t